MRQLSLRRLSVVKVPEGLSLRWVATNLWALKISMSIPVDVVDTNCLSLFGFDFIDVWSAVTGCFQSVDIVYINVREFLEPCYFC